MSIRTREIIGKAILETLENRQMLSTVTLVDGTLVVQGNPNSANQLDVHTASGKVWAVTNGGTSQKFVTSTVRQIRIIGGEKADDVSVDASVRIPVYVQTGNGNDTIQTGDGNDTISSGNGRDEIHSGGGADVVDSGNGDDLIESGGGDDRVDGGNGSDTFFPGKGNDIVKAESGDDSVHGGAGHDRIWLGVGRDWAGDISSKDKVYSDKDDTVESSDVGDSNSELPPTQGGDSGSDNSGSDSGSGTSGSTTGGSSTDSSGSGSDSDGSSTGGSTSGGSTTTVVVPVATSFSILDATTGKSITGYSNVSGTVSIDLTTLPTAQLNIRANYDSSFKGSVVFGWESEASFSTENATPYMFMHDTGNFTPTVGTHTLTATAYSNSNGTGTAGATITLQLAVSKSVAVTQDPAPDPTPAPTPDPTPDPTPIPTPDPTPGTGAPVGVITVMESTVAVDHAIQVNGLSSTLNAGTVLTAKFLWDFGDSGSKYNQLVGWNAAHLYTQPGKYTITLTITNENGKTSSVSRQITIAASNRKVIYVSNDGSDSNTGLSPQSAVQSFGKAMSMVGDNTEILFNSGDEFDMSKGAAIANTNVVIGSYGTGAQPILKYTGARNYTAILSTTGAAKDVTFENLTFESVFTHDLEKTGMPDAIDAGGTNITAYKLTILNIGYGMNTNAKPTGVLMQQCTSPSVTGLRSYMIYGQGSDFVIVGNTVANSTREHCLRVGGADRILIAYNDLTNLDRRPEGDSLDTDKQTITLHKGSYAYIYGNTTHGGRVEIGPLGEADGLKPTNIGHRLNYVRIEANNFTFYPDDRVEIDHGTSEVMVCDNTINVTNGAGIAIQAMGMYTDWPAYGTRHVEDVIVAGDNDITGAQQNVSVGKGSVGIKILPSGSPVYSASYRAAA